jgi:hypothetical protein
MTHFLFLLHVTQHSLCRSIAEANHAPVQEILDANEGGALEHTYALYTRDDPRVDVSAAVAGPAKKPVLGVDATTAEKAAWCKTVAAGQRAYTKACKRDIAAQVAAKGKAVRPKRICGKQLERLGADGELPSGRRLRVFILPSGMRTSFPNAVLEVLTCDMIKPDRPMHCVLRLAEWFLKALQEFALKTNQVGFIRLLHCSCFCMLLQQ